MPAVRFRRSRHRCPISASSLRRLPGNPASRLRFLCRKSNPPQIQTGPLAAPIAAAGTGAGIMNPLPAPPRPTPTAPPKAQPAPRPPDILRSALRPGGQGPIVGDISEDTPRIPGVVPSPCNDCSALQLLSDPKNVDFKPYLLQVLALVKKNWMAVIPDSARLGRKGIVVLKFTIDRRGAVPSLEFSTPSGNDFDHAASPVSARRCPSHLCPPSTPETKSTCKWLLPTTWSPH